ncbi:flagellar biosynthesis protein FlgC, partial [bacterium]
EPGSPEAARVKQGALEMSTSDATLLMAEMVNVSRAFEANMKLLKLQDQTLGELINNAGQQPA